MMPSLSPPWPTWLQPGALMAGAGGSLGLLISALRNLRAGLREEMREMKDESFHRRQPSLESEDQQDFHGANKARGQIKRATRQPHLPFASVSSLLQVDCPFMGHWLIGFPMGEGVPVLKGRGCATSGGGWPRGSGVVRFVLIANSLWGLDQRRSYRWMPPSAQGPVIVRGNPPILMMPSLPPEFLANWLQPGALVALALWEAWSCSSAPSVTSQD